MYNELFVVSYSIISFVIHDIIQAINKMLKNLITWPIGNKMLIGVRKFKDLCGLLNVHGVINGTHVVIIKPSKPFAKDYFYYKSGGYSVFAQVVVDNNKQFIDLFVKLLDLVNDLHVFKKFGHYNSVYLLRFVTS